MAPTPPTQQVTGWKLLSAGHFALTPHLSDMKNVFMSLDVFHWGLPKA